MMVMMSYELQAAAYYITITQMFDYTHTSFVSFKSAENLKLSVLGFINK